MMENHVGRAFILPVLLYRIKQHFQVVGIKTELHNFKKSNSMLFNTFLKPQHKKKQYNFHCITTHTHSNMPHINVHVIEINWV